MPRQRSSKISKREVHPYTHCAIYTRVSTEERLDQDLNSLDAQRKSAEAFIESRRAEGWICSPDRYDDAGFSGADMNRPALRRLLADVEEKKVQTIITYKIDRLTRSIHDFCKIMETLEEHGVGFVAVTQSIDTTDSVGRLNVNILMSFAQFEREIIGERTRDKIAMSKRMGKWMGGNPILGYDVDGERRRLVVNEDEVGRVQEMFRLYLEHDSLVAVVEEMNRRGWRTKKWISKAGKIRGGGEFHVPLVRGLLRNIAYIGKVAYKDEVYEGEHDGIVEEKVWQEVQERLKQRTRGGGRNRTSSMTDTALLRGLLVCEACNVAMVPNNTPKGNVRYHYYICSKAQRQGWDSCPVKSVSAPGIETSVVRRVRGLSRQPGFAAHAAGAIRRRKEMMTQKLKGQIELIRKKRTELSENMDALIETSRRKGKLGDDGLQRWGELNEQVKILDKEIEALEAKYARTWDEEIDEEEVRHALDLLDRRWDGLTFQEQKRLLYFLVERVGYDRQSVKIDFREGAFEALVKETRNLKKRIGVEA